MPWDLRRSVVLIGGAASVAHGMSDRKTKDADILVSAKALAYLEDAVNHKRGGFHRDTDLEIFWETPVGFNVRVELVLEAGPFVLQCPDVVNFGKGFIPTLPELVRMRAETIVARGDGQDYFDLRRLLPMTRQRGLKLAHIEEEELQGLVEAVEMLEDEELEQNYIDILSTFVMRGRRWGSWREWFFWVRSAS